jgi:hypothetical protein
VAPSTGFSGAAAPKPEEHVTQLLDLYSLCLVTVQQNKKAEDAKAATRPNLSFGAEL